MNLGVVQSRTGLGVAVVAIGAIGAAAVALFGPKNAYDDSRHSIGPVVTALPRKSVPVYSTCPWPESDDYYYPAWIFTNSLVHDYSFRNSYPRYLRALDEPSLSCGDTGADESYRFLFLPSFHGTIVVRIERTGSKIQLHTAMLGGPRGSDIVESADRKLRKEQWDELLRCLSAAQFWETPVSDDRVGIDGDNWLIEGRVADRYWVVEKYTPSRSDAFGVAGIRFLQLAKMMKEAAPELYPE